VSRATAIEARDLFRIYESAGGNAAALQGLTLSVRPGEILVVLGPSGSGKTTLLRILAGLDRPSAGRAIVNGTDLAGLSSRALARYRAEETGYADQHYSRALAPELTARELVGLRLGLEGATRAERGRRADELLKRVGLAAKRDSRPYELSGGEQQRVVVCAALAHGPRLLFADEPTGELDHASAATLYEVLGELARAERCTTVIVSHDPESASIADRIVHVRDGRLSAEWAREAGCGCRRSCCAAPVSGAARPRGSRAEASSSFPWSSGRLRRIRRPMPSSPARRATRSPRSRACRRHSPRARPCSTASPPAFRPGA